MATFVRLSQIRYLNMDTVVALDFHDQGTCAARVAVAKEDNTYGMVRRSLDESETQAVMEWQS